MDIKDLIEQADLLEYISQYVEMKRDGGEWFGICPFHGDSDPSFSISEKNPHVYYCFGCGSSGNIIHFIQKWHNCRFAKAIEILKQYVGYDGELINKRNSDSLRIFKEFKRKPIEAPCAHIHFAKDYMDRFNPNAVQIEEWVDEGISREALKKFNVSFDERDNRIVYPIKDINGEIISVSGRTVDPNWKLKKLRKYTYYGKIETVDLLYGLYENLEEIKNLNQIIIFEGAKSVMKAYGYGYKNCAALLTSHLNDWQLKLLIRLGCDVVFALDKDADPFKDKNILKLTQFCTVFTVKDKDNLLEPKDSPVDKGKVIFDTVFCNKVRVK